MPNATAIVSRGACMALALALTCAAPAGAASELATLLDLPVSGRVIVPASKCRDLSPQALRSASAVDLALGVVGGFEGRRQLIVQANDSAESPAATRLTVIRDGLLDDAVRSERWDIELVRNTTGAWQIHQASRSWRCWRGAGAVGFDARACP